MALVMTVVGFIKDYGPTAALVSLVIWLLWILADEDRSALWRGRFFKALYKVSGRRDDEKRYISNDIKGKINLARRELNYANRVLPNAIDVEWVDGEEPESYDVEEGEFIVRLDPSEDQPRNIVYMAETIVRRTNIVGARRVVPPELLRSIDLHLTRKLLKEADHRPSIDVFQKEAYEPAVGSSADFDDWNEQIIEVDNRGLYERLLLVELEEFAREIAGQAPRPYMIGEVEDLVDYVYTLATKEVREDVPLKLVRAHISVAVGLVSKGLKIVDSGAEYYVERTKETIEGSDSEALYVVIWGKPDLRVRNLNRWRAFKREVNRLISQTEALPETTRTFSSDYEYTAHDGEQRDGQIHRFTIER